MKKDISNSGRPYGRKQELYQERDRLVINSLEQGFTQSEIADIFRVPRNTIHQIIKKYK